MSISDQNIAILYGGWSDERDISLDSGKSVFDTLSANGYKAYLFDFNSDNQKLINDFILKKRLIIIFKLSLLAALGSGIQLLFLGSLVPVVLILLTIIFLYKKEKFRI